MCKIIGQKEASCIALFSVVLRVFGITQPVTCLTNLGREDV